MNASRLDELRLLPGGSPRVAANDTSDQQMDQIRELLFGEMRRQLDTRLSQLEQRVDAMEARIASMSGEIDADRRTAFDALARGISDLGEQIRRTASKP
jgi:CHASE3 domain sensor protein